MYTISLPSMDRSFFPFGKVFPQNDISPETRLTFPGSTPMIDCAINVLPEPVSPMRAKLSPGKIWKETPQTSSFSASQSTLAITADFGILSAPSSVSIVGECAAPA